MYIYADHAATTKLDIDAFEAMQPYMIDEYANASQPYSFSRSVKAAIRSAREKIALCINADPEEIYFTSGGTESDNWAIKGIAFSYGPQKKIITSAIEHHAILNSCKSIERMGYPVNYLPVDKIGNVQPDILNKFINKNTSMVSVMYGNNEIGTIEPVNKLCEIAHENGALFHTDAVQVVGHIPIDVKELNLDMLSASAHKFNGPKGIGFLYVKKGTQIVSYEDGGAQEFGMRAGTENIPAIVGMAVALEKNCHQIAAVSEHLNNLEKILISSLHAANLDFIRNGSEKRIPGNISLSFRNANGEALLHRLDLMGIAVSTGSACDSKNTQLSHVLSAIHLPEDYAYGTIRISLGAENTVEDAEKIASSIAQILK